VDQARALLDLTDPEALIGLSAEERAAVVNFSIPAGNPTRVQGAVTDAGNGAPIAAARVSLPGIGATATDAEGQYSFEGIPEGTYAMAAATGSMAASRDVTVSGGTLTVDFAVTPAPTVLGFVQDSNGAPVPYARVGGVDAQGVVSGETTTDWNGSFSLQGLPAGDYTLVAVDGATNRPGHVGVLVNGVDSVDAGGITLLGDDQVGSIFVSASFADSGLPAPAGAIVPVRAEGYSPVWRGSLRLDGDGRGSVWGVPPGEVMVSATVPPDYDGSAAATVLPMETADIVLLLVRASTLTQLSGTVTEARSGAPLAGAAVTLTGPTTRATTTDASGGYVFDDVAPGDYTLTAEIGGRTASQPLTASGGPLVVNLAIAAPLLSGFVQDAAGLRVVSAVVRAKDLNGGLAGETVADGAGAFSVPGLPAGDYALVAVDPATNRPGQIGVSTNGIDSIDVGGITLLGDAQVGTVHVTAFLADSGLPAPGGTAVFVSTEGFQPPFWEGVLTLDETGQGTLAGVPLGLVNTFADAPPNYLGWEDAALPTPGTADVLLRLSPRQRWVPIDLTGANGLPLFAAYEGDVWSDDVGSCVPFCGTYAKVDATYYPGRAAADVSDDGREVTNGTRTLSGLVVSRRAFVPPDGRFVRHLDVLSNPTAASITVAYGLSQYLGSHVGDWSVVDTSSGDTAFGQDDDYAVLLHSEPSLPQLALVTSGPGAPGRHDGFVWNTDDRGELYREIFYDSTWTSLTVPPGETVILMQFLAQRANDGDPAPVITQARALADLTDPDALAGLTPEERAAIVNFLVP